MSLLLQKITLTFGKLSRAADRARFVHYSCFRTAEKVEEKKNGSVVTGCLTARFFVLECLLDLLAPCESASVCICDSCFLFGQVGRDVGNGNNDDDVGSVSRLIRKPTTTTAET